MALYSSFFEGIIEVFLQLVNHSNACVRTLHISIHNVLIIQKYKYAVEMVAGVSHNNNNNNNPIDLNEILFYDKDDDDDKSKKQYRQIMS